MHKAFKFTVGFFDNSFTIVVEPLATEKESIINTTNINNSVAVKDIQQLQKKTYKKRKKMTKLHEQLLTFLKEKGPDFICTQADLCEYFNTTTSYVFSALKDLSRWNLIEKNLKRADGRLKGTAYKVITVSE